jgi:hypothetical protein
VSTTAAAPRAPILDRFALHPLLIAAYAVLFLYSVNLDRVLPVDAGAPLVRAVLGSAIAWAVLALVFRDARRGAVVASALVVAFHGYGHVDTLLAEIGVGDGLQLAAWAIVVGGSIAYAARARGSLPRVTGVLNIVGTGLVVVSLAAILPSEADRAGRGSAMPPDAVVAAGSGPMSRRDIYFLVFDRYGSADAIERRFGIRDNELYGWLRDQGFEVPSRPHANYRATDFSLAATLNMRFLDTLTETVGRTSGDRTPAFEMIQDHAVGRFLQAQGYDYYQLGSWYEATRTVAIADENLTLGVASEFESVLDDTTILAPVKRALGFTRAEPTFRDRVREGTLFQLRQLDRLSTAPGPKFVFAHFLLPHDPYVFHADGTVVTAEEERATDERALYEGHLAYANSRIKEIVGTLLSGPEEDRPIVIIQGDEGPLACQNVDCVGTGAEYLRIRLGNLVAMYLPGVDADVPETFTSVNTFRTVFRAYFGADLPPLPDRSYTWPDDDSIYDFQDVTGLLAEPGG